MLLHESNATQPSQNPVAAQIEQPTVAHLSMRHKMGQSPKLMLRLSLLSFSVSCNLGSLADLRSHRYFSSNSNGGGAGAASKEAALDKMFDELRGESCADTLQMGPGLILWVDLSRDSNDAISAESTMAYLADLGVDMENAEMFVALELVQAPSFGEITRTGFVEGWKAAGYASCSKYGSPDI